MNNTMLTSIMQYDSVFAEKKIFGYSVKKLRCARCGHGISMDEYTQCCEMIKILGSNYVMHYCSTCFEIINR